MSDNIKLVIEIPKDYYKVLTESEIIMTSPRSAKTFMSVIYSAIAHGIPLDDLATQIERLKHQHTDVSGYRWWNNAINNCLHTIRDVCDEESEE